jgi:hypothetical protein
LKFSPKNFRQLSQDSQPGSKIREGKHLTLILVKESGEAMFANTRTGKDELIAQFNPQADLLLLAWTGEWRTDIFHLSSEDVQRHYK